MNYHVVLEGYDGFQKEEERAFPQDSPPHSLILRQYESLAYHPLSFVSLAAPPGEFLNIKERVFRLKDKFYALGRQIVHYQEFR